MPTTNTGIGMSLRRKIMSHSAIHRNDSVAECRSGKIIMIQIHCVRSNSFTLFVHLSCSHAGIYFCQCRPLKNSKCRSAHNSKHSKHFSHGDVQLALPSPRRFLSFVYFYFILFHFNFICTFCLRSESERKRVCVCILCTVPCNGLAANVTFHSKEEKKKKKNLSFELRMVSYRQWHRQTTDEQLHIYIFNVRHILSLFFQRRKKNLQHIESWRGWSRGRARMNGRESECTWAANQHGFFIFFLLHKLLLILRLLLVSTFGIMCTSADYVDDVDDIQ